MRRRERQGTGGDGGDGATEITKVSSIRRQTNTMRDQDKDETNHSLACSLSESCSFIRSPYNNANTAAPPRRRSGASA